GTQAHEALAAMPEGWRLSGPVLAILERIEGVLTAAGVLGAKVHARFEQAIRRAMVDHGDAVLANKPKLSAGTQIWVTVSQVNNIRVNLLPLLAGGSATRAEVESRFAVVEPGLASALGKLDPGVAAAMAAGHALSRSLADFLTRAPEELTLDAFTAVLHDIDQHGTTVLSTDLGSSETPDADTAETTDADTAETTDADTAE